MKTVLNRYFVVLYVLTAFTALSASGQQYTRSGNALNAAPPNYFYFLKPFTSGSPEVRAGNKGFEKHPELGQLFVETPCDNCFEELGRRTEYSKFFVRLGTHGRQVMEQTSNAPMHYKDEKGEWLTIKAQIAPDTTTTGMYTANEQETPVCINTNAGLVTMGRTGRQIVFNHDLELIAVMPTGVQTSLGKANWKHYTAGDDGVYVTDGWPGIDIEIHVLRGAVKTNFHINHALPAYAGGNLLIRDHEVGDGGLHVATGGRRRFAGGFEVDGVGGALQYAVSAATAFEEKNPKATARVLEYAVDGSAVDITVPGDFLNRPASAYPVIIDPLLTDGSTSSVYGSTYSTDWSVGCVYTNAATVPAKVTVTDIQFSFQYVTSGGALLENGAFDFKTGTCRSPTPAGIYWNCNSALTGTCTGTDASIYASFEPCFPAPECASFNLNLTMDFYQDYAIDVACGTAYISAGSPLLITVFGETVTDGNISSPDTNICAGQSTTLSTLAQDGVGPYSYSWMPGALTGTSVTVTPSATTIYSVTTTDACGDASTATKTVVVNPIDPIGGATSACAGSTAILTNAVAGGTWTSVPTAVATIGSATGVLTGVSAGTALISYVSPAGCASADVETILTPPPGILGASSVCEGSTTALSDGTTGGTWTSSNASVAPIGYTTGTVSGVGAGTAVITYTAPGGCMATKTVVVSAITAITGAATACVGGSATLADGATGGTWSTTNGAVALVNAVTGVVTGVAAGTTTISYVLGGCAVSATATVTVITGITGVGTVCEGSSVTLADATGGGAWTSGNTAVATAGLLTGIVSGVGGGTAVISYTLPGGCYTTTAERVYVTAPISGAGALCLGSNATLTNTVAGGTWQSTNSLVASVGTASGYISALLAGTSVIQYATPAGCVLTATETVLPPPAAINATTPLCAGYTEALTEVTTGGVWQSSNAAVATVGSATGLATGIEAGTTTITYSLTSGCYATTVLTVNPLSAITGTTVLCMGDSALYADLATGGTWQSTNSLVAGINTTTGVATSVSAGTTEISYTTPAGCAAGVTLTVDAVYPITGTFSVCEGSSTTLGNPVSGGTWSSSSVATAPVGAFSGIVAGVTAGTAVISYTLPGGCYSVVTVTVNPMSPVSGVLHVCAGSTALFADATTGGNWSSSNIAVATIGSASGLLSGLLAGTAAIWYTLPTGCFAFVTETVYPVAPVSGTSAVCLGNTTAMTDAVSGGTWSSSAPLTGGINTTTGLLSGVSAGTAIISYTNPWGCVSTVAITVNPEYAITGSSSVCAGYSTLLSNTVGGGVWSSSNATVAAIGSVTGNVTGGSAGVSVIQYTTPAGCISTFTMTVDAHFAITGASSVCQGNSITLSNLVPAGTWLSSITAVATITTSTGVLTGIMGGTTSVTYTTPTGCSSVALITVNPITPIAGTEPMCQGTSVTLTNATGGGTWASTNIAVGTVGVVSGIVTGISAGTTLISYSTLAGCAATTIVVVNPLFPITGPATVCEGSAITLADAAGSGTWTSSAATIATVGVSTGVVNGVSQGTALISYTSPAGCLANAVITVYPLAAITGPATVCVGSSAMLADAVGGGTWSSTFATIGNIDEFTGVLTGINAGATVVKYTTPNGCIATKSETVFSQPGPITGNTYICIGETSLLSDALAGGTWQSGNISVASIGVSSGMMTGVSANTVIITYMTNGGCFATTLVTVNPLPAVISGATSMCVGAHTTLTDATAGGIWQSSNTAVGIIDGVSGFLNAASAGTTIITYTTLAGCSRYVTVTVHPLPAAITGIPDVCAGSSVTLAETLAGGMWSSSNTAVATIGAGSGIMNGVAAGSAIVTYTSAYGCISTIRCTVYPTPVLSAYTATGPTTCATTDGTITFSGLTPGNIYVVRYENGTHSDTVVLEASVSGDIEITGLAAGSYIDFTVTSSSGCTSNAITGPIVLSLPANPPAPRVSNNSPICAGSTLLLYATDSISGVTYNWTGPAGFVSALQNPVITGAGTNAGGTYSVTATHLSCVSVVALTIATVHPIPGITGMTNTNPTTCDGKDGTITLTGLLAGVFYTITFIENGNPETDTATANKYGAVTITGLPQGNYKDFSVSSYGCVSNTAGPETLSDPVAAPPPYLTANSPICAGETLQLESSDLATDLTYSWTGPNGFTANIQNPQLPGITQADSGVYSLTILHVNCPSSSSIRVEVYPPVVLYDVTPSQTIGIGSTVVLMAKGAEFYLWSPDDGTIANPNSDSTVAQPQQNAAYLVQGMNTWGCTDTATVNIAIDYYINEYVPNAFTPNNDGKNDEFKIGNINFDRLLDFSIYDRWGKMVYHNSSDASKGWDGTYGGVPQDIGTYNYTITLATPEGKLKYFKGTVELLR